MAYYEVDLKFMPKQNYVIEALSPCLTLIVIWLAYKVDFA